MSKSDTIDGNLTYKSNHEFDLIREFDMDSLESINEADFQQVMETFDTEKNLNPKYNLIEETPLYIRHQFLRKVFFILVLQILTTFGFTALAYFIPQINDLFSQCPYISIGCGAVYCVMIIVCIIFPKTLENTICCIIFLATTTGLLSLLVASTCCFFDIKEIAIALAITVLVFISLMILSYQTKYDLTRWLGFTIVLSLIMVYFAIVLIFVPIKPLCLVFTIASTIATCIYVLVDMQLIIGGKRKYQFTVDQYMLATTTIYCDFISLFLNILRFFRF
uniref:Transmembrane protein, conserved n=1 Tax=Theileria annulata TaxID=5874 RepID=A0A3B0MII6_THEAN